MSKPVTVVFKAKGLKTILEEQFDLENPEDILRWAEYLQKEYSQIGVAISSVLISQDDLKLVQKDLKSALNTVETCLLKTKQP